MVHCNVCKYKDNCKPRLDEPLLSGCTSGHPMEFITTSEKYILCPVCEHETCLKIRSDTKVKNLIVVCPNCNKESVINIDEKSNDPSCKCRLLRFLKGDKINDLWEVTLFSDDGQMQILKKTLEEKYYVEYRYDDFRKNRIVEVKNCPLCGELF